METTEINKPSQEKIDAMCKGFFEAAKHLIDASSLVRPFNDLSGVMILKQAEGLLDVINKLKGFEEQDNSSSCQINKPKIELSPKVIDEVQDLENELLKELGDLGEL